MFLSWAVSSRARSRRMLAALAVVLLAVMTGCAGGGDDSADQAGEQGSLDTVRILVNPGSNSHVPIYVAQDAGIFRENGLDVQIVTNATAIQPLLTGDVDVAFPSPGQALIGNEQGHDLRIFMTLIDKVLQAVVVRDEPKSGDTEWPDVLRQLKGKTLGVTVRGGAVDLNLRYVLREAGLNPDSDVTIVPTGNASAMLAAMQGKRVDGIMSLQPITAQLVTKKSGHVLVNLAKGEGPETMNQPFITGVAAQSFIDAKPEVLDKLVKSLKQAQEYIHDSANKSKFADIVKKRVYSTLTPSEIDEILAELSATTKTICFASKDLDNIAEVLISEGVIKKEASASSTIYTKAQEAAGCAAS